MPRPRFHKLEPEKQRRILECAAVEFGACGLEGASLNRIIEKAGISKGAVYYYFDDKTDLLATVLEWTFEKVFGMSDTSFDTLTEETFWPALRELYGQSMDRARREPWAIAVYRVFYKLPSSVRDSGALSRVQDSVAAWTVMLLGKGQELGVVRSDLPSDLLVALVMSLDEATDRWMLEHWEKAAPAEMDAIVGSLFDLVKRMLEPAVAPATRPTPRGRRR